MTFFRRNIEEMTAYVPGEQPRPGEKVIKLNTNENPYPPSPAAMKACREFDGEGFRRYPDPLSTRFRQVAGHVLNVPPEWVLPANGSDELLTMICRACLEPGRKAAAPMPTYVLYMTLAKIQDAEFVEIPFDEDYTLPVQALITADAAVTLVASPNSPSGTLAPTAALAELARALAGVLVIDEAYVDFADENALALAREFPNVVILRTLSKSYSLAGLRLGLAVAQPGLLAGLLKVKDSYNVDALACAVGSAALKDQAHLKANVTKVRASREKLSAGLAGLGFRVWPSQSNFLLVRPPRGDAERLYLALKAGGILVRYFKQPRLDDKLRISVGDEDQNAALLRELKANL